MFWHGWVQARIRCGQVSMWTGPTREVRTGGGQSGEQQYDSASRCRANLMTGSGYWAMIWGRVVFVVLPVCRPNRCRNLFQCDCWVWNNDHCAKAKDIVQSDHLGIVLQERCWSLINATGWNGYKMQEKNAVPCSFRFITGIFVWSDDPRPPHGFTGAKTFRSHMK